MLIDRLTDHLGEDGTILATITEEDNQGEQEASGVTPSTDPSRAEAANDPGQESDTDSDI